MGHTCSLWMHHPWGAREKEWPAVLRRKVVERFAPVKAPLIKEFEHFYGADVVVATGWQTVYPVLLLEGCSARAYLINDHEPEFHPTSVEYLWAQASYSQGLHGIAGTPWLRDLYVERYGGEAGTFEYGVDHATYGPRDVDAAGRHGGVLRSRVDAPARRRARHPRAARAAPPPAATSGS